MQTTAAAKITVVLDDDLGGGPADETLRLGIGGTAYEIDLSDRGRIPASIVPAVSSRPREDGAASLTHR